MRVSSGQRWPHRWLLAASLVLLAANVVLYFTIGHRTWNLVGALVSAFAAVVWWNLRSGAA